MYLKDNILPLNLSQNQKQNFIHQSARYTVIVNILYRRGLDNTLLRCLEHEESGKSLKEVHEGICGIHSSGLMLVKKLF